MRNLTIFALALIAFATATLAQAPDTAWTRTVSNPGDHLTTLTTNSNGEIVAAGGYAGLATWRRWDRFGDLLDSNLAIGYELGDTSITAVTAIALCSDGSGDYVLGGMADALQQPGLPYFPFAARLNWHGDVLWRQCYGCVNDTIAAEVRAVVTRPDGSAILFGYRFSGQCFAIGVNASGEALWCRSYPISSYGFDPVQGATILGMPDGGALLSGFSLSADTCTVRIDAQGEIVWANGTQFSRALALHPDTILCTMWYDSDATLYVFRMTGDGDTLRTAAYPYRSCWKLIAEPGGGWSIFGADHSTQYWQGCFDANGNLLWSTSYPIPMAAVVRLRHADYAFIDITTNMVGKTGSGPRHAPDQLTVTPMGGGLLFYWPEAEWQFYHLYSATDTSGPFTTWEGMTAAHVFWRSLDPLAPRKFYVIVGSDSPSH